MHLYFACVFEEILAPCVPGPSVFWCHDFPLYCLPFFAIPPRDVVPVDVEHPGGCRGHCRRRFPAVLRHVRHGHQGHRVSARRLSARGGAEGATPVDSLNRHPAHVLRLRTVVVFAHDGIIIFLWLCLCDCVLAVGGADGRVLLCRRCRPSVKLLAVTALVPTALRRWRSSHRYAPERAVELWCSVCYVCGYVFGHMRACSACLLHVAGPCTSRLGCVVVVLCVDARGWHAASRRPAVP